MTMAIFHGTSVVPKSEQPFITNCTNTITPGANFMESVTVSEKLPLTLAETCKLAVSAFHGLARNFDSYACVHPVTI